MGDDGLLCKPEQLLVYECDGFTIENANGEGVLAGVDALTDAGQLPAAGPVLSDVTVSNNLVDVLVRRYESSRRRHPHERAGAGAARPRSRFRPTAF